MPTIVIAIGAFFLGILISLSPCSGNASIVMGIHLKQPNTLKHILIAILILTCLITLIINGIKWLFLLHDLSSLFVALMIIIMITLPKTKIAISKIIQPIKRWQLTSNTPFSIRVVLATICHPCSLPGLYALSRLSIHSLSTTLALMNAIGLVIPCLYFRRYPHQPKLHLLTTVVDLIFHGIIIICMITHIHHQPYNQLNALISNIFLLGAMGMLLYHCHTKKAVIKTLIA